MVTIKFAAQEDWTVTDLQLFFHQINILYNRLFVLDELKPGGKVRLATLLANSLARVPAAEQLRVDYIEIHSPARFSLSGADKIIGQLRGLLKDVWYGNRMEGRRLAQELEHQARLNDMELARQRTALLQQQIEIMHSAGFSEQEVHDSVRKLLDPLEKLAGIMQDRAVRVLDESEE